VITLPDALNLLLSTASSLETETVKLDDANGRVLAETINSKSDVPPFRRSLYDGFACRSRDTLCASRQKPVHLRIIGAIGAGDFFAGQIPTGACIRIMTGAPVPASADTVVAMEDISLSGDSILVYEPVMKAEKVSQAGADIPGGLTVLTAGTLLSPAHLGVLASLGHSRPLVYHQLCAAVMATGSELVPPGEPLAAAKIYDSNSIMAAALASGCGALITARQTVPDIVRRLTSAVCDSLPRCDVLIMTGGVSSGDYDLTARAVLAAGAEILFHRVNFKPGGAMLAAMVQDKLIFCLSGKPTGAWVGFNLLVRPALFYLQGRVDRGQLTVEAVLEHKLDKGGRLDRFIPAITLTDTKKWKVAAAGYKYPGTLYALSRANSLINMPAFAESLAEGQPVPVRLLSLPTEENQMHND
jgi:molybdopterin molybdotransferase